MFSVLFSAVIAIVFTTVSVDGQAPIVTITQTDPASSSSNYIQAIRDEDVVMDCFVENLPVETTVRWQRTYRMVNGTSSVIALSQDMALEDNIHYSIERPTQFTWRLRIRSVQVTDDGMYQCYVLTSLNSRAKDQRTVYVAFSPYFDLQQTSSDTSVDTSETVILTCNATARPNPTIEWARLGGKLLPIGQERKLGSILNIESIRPGDRGVYRCEAVNIIGRSYTDIHVEVMFAPIVTVNPDTVYQAIGYRTELQCFGEANPDAQRVKSYWSRGGVPLPSSSDEYEERFLQGAFGFVTFELIIYNVQESSYGPYSCIIGNDKGDGINTVNLVKTDVPQASIKLGRIIALATTFRFSYLLLIVAAVMSSVLIQTLF